MRQAITKQWTLCCYALSFFSRVPVPASTDFKAYPFHLGNAYFPFVGLLYAFLCLLAYSFTHLFFDESLSVLLMLIVGLLFTGALHEDGLADSADGFGGGYNKAQRLTIMKDSQIGAYGVIALIMLLALKLISLTQLAELSSSTLFVTFVVASVLSRASALLIMQYNQYARLDESSKSTQSSQALPKSYFVTTVLLSLLVLFLLPFSTALTVLCLLIANSFFWQRYFNNSIDGYTGDCLGLLQQLNELLIVLTCLATLS
ncbi:adenosylcobinamide-GDP ribazoletransferase [Psychromonas sp. B3M02]|uniref:adenosylcobinamide-GDP ribazoletransferase n=1 Tax=Psychromonas sp. B3M02 TaxID=2267226 RepID=UPI000DEAF69D|nr:adenosylcobinamide-GDP ribazoletransferase [Psychromonas sp. B3M02]RBW41384.1 adenosylcobinamide-GDP ribazoletransferase [Psychromonas sp. B3M02]